MSRRIPAAMALAGATLAVPSCAVRSYLDPSRPFYRTSHGVPRDTEAGLRVVTFNVKEGQRVREAAAALGAHDDLRDADVVVLQEMNADAVESVARALRMNSVYYPATREPRGPDWGNAILSPWPIEDARKLLLPHPGRFRRRGRTATSALVHHPSGTVRVYSTHLGSPWDTGEGSRRDQAASILDDAEGRAEPVVVAGDFNSEKIGRLFTRRGYCWPTAGVGPTIHGYSVDHVFARGLCAGSGRPRSGVARDVRDASDHRPVWAVLSPPRKGQDSGLTPDRW
jgi:endonuclease/exonuclease/phosphatase family metal-dependent hydrolase